VWHTRNEEKRGGQGYGFLSFNPKKGGHKEKKKKEAAAFWHSFTTIKKRERNVIGFLLTSFPMVPDKKEKGGEVPHRVFS